MTQPSPRPGPSLASTAQAEVVRLLEEAHDVERLSLDITATAGRLAEDRATRELFAEHHAESEQHERFVLERLDALGGSPSHLRGRATTDAAGSLQGLTGARPVDLPLRLVRDTFAHEQFEIATYEVLWRMAERAGDRATAQVTQLILTQELATARRIADLWDPAIEQTLAAVRRTAAP